MSVRDAPRPWRHVELELSSTRSIQSVLFKLLWRDTRSRSSRTALPLEISSLPLLETKISSWPTIWLKRRTTPLLETLVISIMRSIWLGLRHTQESRKWRSNPRFIDSSSQMDMVLSSLPRVDFSILDAPLDIHLSLCLAHSQTRLLPRSTFGRTRVQQNTRRVRSTNFPRSLMRKSPGCILRHSTLSWMSLPKKKLTTFAFQRMAHSKTISTDIDFIHIEIS